MSCFAPGNPPTSEDESSRICTVVFSLGSSGVDVGTARSGDLTRPQIKIALTPGSIGVVVKSQQELNELAHRHRFEAVEPRAEEIAAMSPEHITAMIADVKAKGLTWAAAGLTVDFRKDDATFRDGMGKLPRIAAGLKAAGASRVGTWLAPSHGELTYRANYRVHVARLTEIARVLKDHGLRFGLEYVGTQLSMVGKNIPLCTRWRKPVNSSPILAPAMWVSCSIRGIGGRRATPSPTCRR